MKEEIKSVVEDLANTVLDRMAEMINGDIEIVTRENMIETAVNVALLKINMLIKSAKGRTVMKLKEKGGNVKLLTQILNEEF